MTQRVLARAEGILERLSPEDTVTLSAFGYTESQLRFHEGSALTLLGSTKAAYVAQERALGLIASEDFTDSALVRLDRALCLLLDGDANGSAECALACLLALTTEQRRGIIAGRARELVEMVQGRQGSSPAVRDLRDALMLSSGRIEESE
jgi:hypothetical protein